jgi:pimeloyl-ACP methyl ester carboxylesterase
MTSAAMVRSSCWCPAWVICEAHTVSRHPRSVDAGYRVACTDLRGHGDSDTTFTSYGDVETAGDIIALIEELDGPAVVVGNSMGAGAAAYAAAERPDLINGLVLVGPFVRNGKTTAMQRVF